MSEQLEYKARRKVLVKLQRWFLLSSVVILVLTGLGKVISATGEAPILSRSDPLFRVLENREMLIVAALMELGVAGWIVCSRDSTGSLGLIGCLGVVFIFYRLGLGAIGYEAPCECLGAFTEAIGVGATMADWIAKGALGYLLGGSFSLLSWEWVRVAKETRTEGPSSRNAECTSASEGVDA